MKYLATICLLLTSVFAKASVIDTVAIHSNAMGKDFNCIVISPDTYKSSTTRFPVVYLLHGYSGNYTDWLSKAPGIRKEADEKGFIIVCPDGGFSSWYFDSPVDSTMKYETYIGTEVPAYIDEHYRTIKNRVGRAISGLSMGGHGALFIALRHPETFGAAGSMSGGVDINCCTTRFDVSKRLGDSATHADNWKLYSDINLIETYNRKFPLAMIIDCGTEDFFYEINHRLHEKMLELKIPHDYTERPGVHNWEYWNNAVKYQFLFLKNYFDKR